MDFTHAVKDLSVHYQKVWRPAKLDPDQHKPELHESPAPLTKAYTGGGFSVACGLRAVSPTTLVLEPGGTPATLQRWRCALG